MNSTEQLADSVFQAVKVYIERTLKPALDRLSQLEKALADMPCVADEVEKQIKAIEIVVPDAIPGPPGAPGENGKDGTNGKDAEPVDYAELTRRGVRLDETAVTSWPRAASGLEPCRSPAGKPGRCRPRSTAC